MTLSTNALFPNAFQRVHEVVTRILAEARDGSNLDRRDTNRVPFFKPLEIRPVNSPGPRISAFSRDISADGIGLLHIMPLACGEVIVRIPSRFRKAYELRVRIEWCQDCGEGWYMSGGRMLDVAEASSTPLRG
ncbi:MAG: PilZ domain-containing protein [Planctomycetia bacterium]|nr:PilZ domain-containing protein [Planctomycetia bacterium]